MRSASIGRRKGVVTRTQRDVFPGRQGEKGVLNRRDTFNAWDACSSPASGTTSFPTSFKADRATVRTKRYLTSTYDKEKSRISSSRTKSRTGSDRKHRIVSAIGWRRRRHSSATLRCPFGRFVVNMDDCFITGKRMIHRKRKKELMIVYFIRKRMQSQTV